MRRIIAILSMLLLASTYAAELIRNGSFEELDEKGFASFWKANGLDRRPSAKVTICTSGAPDGMNFAQIVSKDPATSQSDYLALVQDIHIPTLEVPVQNPGHIV